MSRDSQPAFVVTVSGSDASGAAGMQADNRAILAAGAHPLNVVTALTLQTRQGVQSVELSSAELVRLHLLGLLNAYPVKVVKVGMLGSAVIAEVLSKVIEQYPDIRLVLDPVLEATSGRPLLDSAGRELLLDTLLPLTYLLTPNLPELVNLGGVNSVETEAEEAAAAQTLLERGCKAVLVKGGHREGEFAVDRLYYAGNPVKQFSAPMVAAPNTRGTGCVLSSLIAARLAQGESVVEAVRWAKASLFDALSRQQEQAENDTGAIYP